MQIKFRGQKAGEHWGGRRLEIGRRRTLEWAPIGSLDRDIEVSEVVVMRRRSDSWRGIRYEPFCLLLERHPVESKPSRRERGWSCGRQRARRTLMIRYPARTAQFPGKQL